MNTQTMILIALGIALLLVGAIFGVSSGVLDQAGNAVQNLSDKAESGNLESQTTGTEFGKDKGKRRVAS